MKRERDGVNQTYLGHSRVRKRRERERERKGRERERDLEPVAVTRPGGEESLRRGLLLSREELTKRQKATAR